MHQLAIYIDQCSTDCRVLKINDISIYDPDVPITNVVLKINIPGNTCDFLPAFPLNGTGWYTTNTFGITQASCGDGLLTLPDGIYTVTYSVCPNEEVYTTETFLRDCQTRCIILSQLSNIIKGDCNVAVYDGYGNNITNKRIQDLKDLMLFLDIAQSDVKSGKYTQANKILLYISKKLNSFSK